ncbi:shikimate dehydrogenase [Aestuariibius insulae]|uniref:shikimate dehydrogenase n=1 Tax=Aestuariibius insulae TaxID=2058287 RepID=UPI00345F0D02
MTGRIPLAGVVGSPVGHSKSPTLHGHWLKQYGLPGHYVPLHIEADDFESVIRTLPKAGFVGVNVTVPHKIRALDIADTSSKFAERIGAANMLTFRPDGTIYAENSDSYGFLAHLKQSAPDWRSQDGPVLVLGAGGAARAVVAALIEDGATDVVIANRTASAAEDIASVANCSTVDWSDVGSIIEEMQTIVNTTSLGMTGMPPLPMNLSGLPAGQTVMDLVYAPPETELLARARQAGCTAVDGLGMLLHQAVPGFERWFGVMPEVDAELRRAVLG